MNDTTKVQEYTLKKEYQALHPIVGKTIPTMAISTIKQDENRAPSRAKYRIVVLGYFDQHDWSNSDCFAPIMSQMEMRLLIAILVQQRCLPKQAFCQSLLPTTEQYVCRPSLSCPLTPDNTYLLLKRTLYGLRHSPKYCSDKATTAFKSLGLVPCPNAPCLFTNSILLGHPPLLRGSSDY